MAWSSAIKVCCVPTLYDWYRLGFMSRKFLIEIFTFDHCLYVVSVQCVILWIWSLQESALLMNDTLTIWRRVKRDLCASWVVFFSISFFHSPMNFECFTPIISHLYGYLNCHRWEYIIEKSITLPTLHTITINLFVQSVWIFCPAIGCLCWSYAINRNYSMCNHSFFVLPSLLLLLLQLPLPLP